MALRVTLTRVLLPPLWPALVTTFIAFIAAWNEFLFALTFTLTDTQRTVPVAIALISGGSPRELPGLLMAASVLVTVPLVILVLIFQRQNWVRPHCRRVKGLMPNKYKEQHRDQIETGQREQTIGRRADSSRRQPGHCRGRVRGVRWPFGLRKIDPAATDRRAGFDLRRRPADRRTTGQRPGTASAASAQCFSRMRCTRT